MEDEDLKFEGIVEKCTGVGVFKHKTKIWMVFDEMSITLYKLDKRTSCIGSIGVHDIQIARIANNNRSGLEFEINTNTKRYHFIAPSSDQATKWVKVVQKAMSRRTNFWTSSADQPSDRGRCEQSTTASVVHSHGYKMDSNLGVIVQHPSPARSISSVDPPPATPELTSGFNRSVSNPGETHYETISPHVSLKTVTEENLNKVETQNDVKPPRPCVPPPVAKKPSVKRGNATINQQVAYVTSSTYSNEPESEGNQDAYSEITFCNESNPSETNPKECLKSKQTVSNRKDHENCNNSVVESTQRDSEKVQPNVVYAKVMKSSNGNIAENGNAENTSSNDGNNDGEDTSNSPTHAVNNAVIEDDCDFYDDVLGAFNEVFEDLGSIEPALKHSSDTSRTDHMDEWDTAFGRLRNYLEVNCDFNLERHRITMTDPIQMLKEFSA